ncbi:uncharacterized protein ISCGN_010650 [Ixodes scapularis]
MLILYILPNELFVYRVILKKCTAVKLEVFLYYRFVVIPQQTMDIRPTSKTRAEYPLPEWDVHRTYGGHPFLDAIGDIVGKHFAVRCPPNTGSVNFNYKNFYSVQLQAVVDVRCRFTIVQIGANRRQFEGGIFRK